jgi:hypothetical protein
MSDTLTISGKLVGYEPRDKGPHAFKVDVGTKYPTTMKVWPQIEEPKDSGEFVPNPVLAEVLTAMGSQATLHYYEGKPYTSNQGKTWQDKIIVGLCSGEGCAHPHDVGPAPSPSKVSDGNTGIAPTGADTRLAILAILWPSRGEMPIDDFMAEAVQVEAWVMGSSLPAIVAAFDATNVADELKKRCKALPDELSEAVTNAMDSMGLPAIDSMTPDQLEQFAGLLDTLEGGKKNADNADPEGSS